MNKSVCFSECCPFVIKKRDKFTNLPIYLCGINARELAKVSQCPKLDKKSND
jgi:hypothetical protein